MSHFGLQCISQLAAELGEDKLSIVHRSVIPSVFVAAARLAVVDIRIV